MATDLIDPFDLSDPTEYPALLERQRQEIARLRIGQAVIAKQVGFYKPETPDFEFVSVPLGILRRALNCVPPPYPEDGI